MIEKTRKKFVWLTMCLLAVVFSALLLGTSASVYVMFNYGMSQNLQERAEFVFETGSAELGVEQFDLADEARTFIATKSVDGEWELSFSNDFFEQEEVERYLTKIVQNKKNRGHINELYFIKQTQGAQTVVVGIDTSFELIQFGRIVSLGAIMVVLSLLLLYVIVTMVSWWIIRPLSTAFTKQKQFVSDASHELKTPLTIINANVDALCSDVGENKWTENILSQTKRMNGLVVDMLTLAKLEEEQPPKSHKFDMSSTIKNTLLSFESVAFEKGKTLEIDVEEGVEFVGVEQEVQQVVAILCDNAIKHGDEKTTIRANFSTHPLRFSISNKGTDFSEKETQKVFERFWRSDQSRDRKTGGSGLGLSIARGICDKNKWKIMAQSQENVITFAVNFANK